MNTWPQDILFIRYAELAVSAEERLHLLGLIGVLLNKSPGSYAAEHLELGEDDWYALCAWIKQGQGSHFWQLGSQGIHIQQACEKHILIDTSQLLTDLQCVSQKGASSSQRTTLDDIWMMARRYVMTEITLEVN